MFVYQRVDSIFVSEDPPGLASTTLALVDDRAASQKKSWDVFPGPRKGFFGKYQWGIILGYQMVNINGV
jgi:hypothetical protein